MFRSFLLLSFGVSFLHADPALRVEDIALPTNAPPEVGGIDFAPDGSLFVVLRRGDVFRAMPSGDAAGFQWSLFATGFHNGCGIDAVSYSKIRITQMAEMTEAEDTDGDGRADRYRRFAAGWGLSGNYHETNSLADDGHGGYYLAIGTASFNGPTFKHTLGDYSGFGRRGRNFSSVKWRGWVLHSDSEGNLTPFASGFRMHNGIHVDPRGDVWSSDNQGDWKATTPIYHIRKGNFHGHPSSLNWDPNWPADKDPLKTFHDDLAAYDKFRTRAAVLIPYKEMNRSGGEPIEIPKSFPWFAGQMLLPDNNGQRITRIMLEKVNGEYQGACATFLDGGGLRSGNHRIRFSPDGKQIYVGQTVRGWGRPSEGLQRITPLSQTPPFDVQTMKIRHDGFTVAFTRPPQGGTDGITVKSYTYRDNWNYGGNKQDIREHKTGVALDGAMLRLVVSDFTPGRVYDLTLPAMKSADGEILRSRLVSYTANALPSEH